MRGETPRHVGSTQRRRERREDKRPNLSLWMVAERRRIRPQRHRTRRVEGLRRRSSRRAVVAGAERKERVTQTRQDAKKPVEPWETRQGGSGQPNPNDPREYI